MNDALNLTAEGSDMIAYNGLSDLIFSGKIKPGEKLVQRTLAKHLGVTTTPLREAIRRLEGEGLLTTTPNGGAQVRVLNRHSMRGEFMVRRALESEAVAVCTEEARNDELEELLRIGKLCDTELRKKKVNIKKANDLDFQFHFGIFQATNCDELVREFERMKILRYFCHLFTKGENVSLEVSHCSIAECMIERNVEKSVRLIRKHIDAAMAVNLDFYKRRV